LLESSIRLGDETAQNLEIAAMIAHWRLLFMSVIPRHLLVDETMEPSMMKQQQSLLPKPEMLIFKGAKRNGH
jgi:hypothetical protein